MTKFIKQLEEALTSIPSRSDMINAIKAAGTTMNELADENGLSRATLYLSEQNDKEVRLSDRVFINLVTNYLWVKHYAK